VGDTAIETDANKLIQRDFQTCRGFCKKPQKPRQVWKPLMRALCPIIIQLRFLTFIAR